jgi:hypothetical protein
VVAGALDHQQQQVPLGRQARRTRVALGGAEEAAQRGPELRNGDDFSGGEIVDDETS